MGDMTSVDGIFEDENLEIQRVSLEGLNRYEIAIREKAEEFSDGNIYMLNKRKARKLCRELIKIFKLDKEVFIKKEYLHRWGD